MISYIRDLKNEWIHLDKAMKCWLYLSAIVILGFLVFVTIDRVNNHKEIEALYLNYEYCYAVVFKDYFSGKANYRIRIRYIVGDNRYEKGLLPKAHVGDTILIIYNPDKPSFCLPVEFNKNKYVTKKMVDSHKYQIDPDLIH